MVKLTWKQLTTNVLGKIFGVFPEMIVLISGDGFVATANSKGLFEDLYDVPIWTCQGTSCKLPTETISTSYPPTRLLQSLKEVEKEKARAGRWHSGSPNTPPATYRLSGLGQVTPPRCGGTGVGPDGLC